MSSPPTVEFAAQFAARFSARLDAGSGGDEPIYRKLRTAIIDSIHSREIRPGDAVPSSRTLAETIGVSRSTVNLTFQELVAEGFLLAQERVGYVVHPDLAAVNERGGRPQQVDWTRRLVDFGDFLIHQRKPAGRHRHRYPFVVGAPDPELFPTADWTRALRATMTDEHLPAVVYDHIDTDDPLLIEQIRRHVLPTRGISAEPNELLITLGSQHGLHLTAAALVHPGDRVAVENPGYPDAAHILIRAGGDLVPCPVDGDGIVTEDAADISLVMTMPTHHYPTNVTLSASRRRQLLARADAEDLLVIEDDHNSELRHRGQPVPALKSLDRSGRVVHLGTFAEYFGPGLRLGYVVADPALIAKMRDIRRYEMRHPPGQLTRAMALFIERGDFNRAMRRIRTAVRDRWEAASSALRNHLDWDITLPAGGASLWLPGPPALDATTIVEGAANSGLFVESGAGCYLTDPVPDNILNLGIAALKPAAIESGIGQLARAVHLQLEPDRNPGHGRNTKAERNAEAERTRSLQ